MNKIMICLFALAISFSVFSKNVEIQISSKYVKGDVTKIFNSKVIAKLGTVWEIPFEGDKSLKMKMKVTDHVDDQNMAAILLEGQVYEIENGTEKILGHPKIVTSIGKEAKLTTERESGEYLEFKILPVKRIEKI